MPSCRKCGSTYYVSKGFCLFCLARFLGSPEPGAACPIQRKGGDR